MTTILYANKLYPDQTVEREVFGPEVDLRMVDADPLSRLSPTDCAAVEGLVVERHWVTAQDFARFPRLRVIVRMGVGYERIDRQAAAAHGVMVCNVPDYGVMEVADHAIALAIGLRRGLFLYHDTQRAEPPAPWQAIRSPLLRRFGSQSFGIIGLGRIGTAAALRAKALGFRVVFYDPYLPNGTERGLGIARARTLEELLPQCDVLSLHTPLTPATTGMMNLATLSLLPRDAILVSTARGPMIDIDALATVLRSGHLAGAGIDVLPVEPPVEPVPELLRAYRARETWLEGRLVITPHAAFFSPESFADMRRKTAETMAASLLTNTPQNVIAPEMF